MIQYRCLIIMLLSVVVPCVAADAAEPAGAIESSILERYRALLLAQEAPEWEKVQGHLDQLSEDGTGPDIRYEDKSRAGWEPAEHLERVRSMASPQ